MQYNLVAVGGTFDRFHKGHESLLETAFKYGDKVIIGLTTEKMVREKTLSPIIDTYKTRLLILKEFLHKKNYLSRSEIVPLDDPLGPAGYRSDIQALVVGPRFTKEAVNTIKNRIVIINCPVIRTEDGPYLSSTAIRLGRVNRQGVVYQFPNHNLYLSDSARGVLKKPLGTLFKTFPKSVKKPVVLVTVGDETTKLFAAKNMLPDLSIVDFYVQRKKKYSSFDDLGVSASRVVSVENPAGMLTPRLSRAITSSLKRIVVSKKSEAIRVVGEEDLATLLCILFAPLTSLVCYGQPNEGLVMVEVTEQKKEDVAHLLESFTPHSPSATIK